jgi:thioredoxin reductase
VPGEDLSKVVYRLIDPAQYDGRHVLVVGGGDSALEAAATLAERPETTVTLSYRGSAFSRAREQNRESVRTAEAQGRLAVLLESEVVRIDQTEVMLTQRGATHTRPNDAVIVCVGGVLPTQFLKETGIRVETKYGTA